MRRAGAAMPGLTRRRVRGEEHMFAGITIRIDFQKKVRNSGVSLSPPKVGPGSRQGCANGGKPYFNGSMIESGPSLMVRRIDVRAEKAASLPMTVPS